MFTFVPSNLKCSPCFLPTNALGVPPLKSNCIPSFPKVLSFILNNDWDASNTIFEPLVSEVEDIVNPPIVPALAVITPAAFTLNAGVERVVKSLNLQNQLILKQTL